VWPWRQGEGKVDFRGKERAVFFVSLRPVGGGEKRGEISDPVTTHLARERRELRKKAAFC